MAATVLCDDVITYRSDPIIICKKTLKSINLQILGLVMDPSPTKEKEATRNELCCRACYLEVSNNESFARIIVQ